MVHIFDVLNAKINLTIQNVLSIMKNLMHNTKNTIILQCNLQRNNKPCFASNKSPLF